MGIDWAATARITAILAGIVFGSVAISAASWVWIRKQVFAYGGSALCMSGVVLLGLSIWHSVEFGVSATTGITFKAAQEAVEISQTAAKSAETAAQAANTAATLAAKAAATSPTDETKRAATEQAAAQAKAAQDASKAAANAAQDVARSINKLFGFH